MMQDNPYAKYAQPQGNPYRPLTPADPVLVRREQRAEEDQAIQRDAAQRSAAAAGRQAAAAERTAASSERAARLEQTRTSRKTEDDLRTQLVGQQTTKDFREMRTRYFGMRSLIKGQNDLILAGRQPSAASDIALIFNFMKMLDPSSVVRESEYANAKNAAGVDERVRNAYNQARDGSFLTPSQRGEFLKVASDSYVNQRGLYNELVEQYRGFARDYGANPDNVGRTYQRQRSSSATDGRVSPTIRRVR